MTSNDDYPWRAKNQIESLIRTLRAYTENDSEQEVRGIAVPVLDAVIAEVKGALGDDPVVQSVDDIISADTIAAGEPIRAIDALLVAEQLDAALGQRPPSVW